MSSDDNKKQKTTQKPAASSKIKEEHVVRLRHTGDGANRPCANTATHLWKTTVCKEHFRKEDGTLDLDGYKQALREMLTTEGVNKDPIFVCSEEKLKKNPMWFVDPNVSVCTDEGGIKYYQVKDYVVIKDLTQPRESGQVRKERKRSHESVSSPSSFSTADSTPPSSSSSLLETVIFSPTIIGTLMHQNANSMAYHKTLRTEIKDCKTVKDCVGVYDDPVFQACLGTIRQTQDQFLELQPFIPGLNLMEEADGKQEHSGTDGNNFVEEWAKQWAQGVSRQKEWALILEDCRKTAFLLLKKVCDLWNWKSLEDGERPENNQVMEEFQKRRIHQIMWYTLVMDRANALYNMALNKTVAKKVRGLCWYSVYDDSDDDADDGNNDDDNNGEDTNSNDVSDDNDGSPRAIAGMPRNPLKPAMNRRYVWLYYQLYSAKDKAITKWMQIAFPPRLGTPEQMKDELFRQELREAREAKLNEEIGQVATAREEALQRLKLEMNKVVHAMQPAELNEDMPPPKPQADDLARHLQGMGFEE